MEKSVHYNGPNWILYIFCKVFDWFVNDDDRLTYFKDFWENNIWKSAHELFSRFVFTKSFDNFLINLFKLIHHLVDGLSPLNFFLLKNCGLGICEFINFWLLFWCRYCWQLFVYDKRIKTWILNLLFVVAADLEWIIDFW